MLCTLALVTDSWLAECVSEQGPFGPEQLAAFAARTAAATVSMKCALKFELLFGVCQQFYPIPVSGIVLGGKDGY